MYTRLQASLLSAARVAKISFFLSDNSTNYAYKIFYFLFSWTFACTDVQILVINIDIHHHAKMQKMKKIGTKMYIITRDYLGIHSQPASDW